MTKGKSPFNFERILENTILILAFSLLIVMFSSVINRYLLHRNMAWSTEILKFLFIWLNFLAGALGVKRGSHIGVRILYEIIPSKKIKTILSFFSSSLVIGLLITLSLAASFLIYKISKFGQVTSYLGLPYIYWYLAIPAGYCLMILFFISKNVTSLKGESDHAASD